MIGDLLLLGRRLEVELAEGEQPGQLGDRRLVVVDPQVDGDVVEAAVPGALLDHEQRRRLPAAGVAARRVTGGQGLEQPPRQRRLRVGGLPRGPHREHDVLAGEDVALDGVAVTGEAARPVETGVPGVRGGAAVDVDDADLALLALLVLLEQPEQRHRRGRPVVEVGQGQALVGHVGVRLGRDRADSGHRGRYGGPDREELRRHRHPPRLSVFGPGHDRERHGPHDSERIIAARAPEARLPVRRPPPAVRDRDRHRRGRQRRVHADLDALLPRRHRPDPGAGRRGDLAGQPGRAAERSADRVGGRPGRRQAGAAGRQRAPGRRLRGLPVLRLLRRGDRLDGRGGRRPDRVLGLLRQHRRRDLGAGGAGEVVRLPRGAPQRGLRPRRPRLRSRDHDRDADGVRRGRGRERRVVRRGVRPAPRGAGDRAWRARAAARLVGDRAARRALPGAVVRAVRVLHVDDGAQLRDAGLRHHRARAARLGDRRGVHHQHDHGRARPGAWRCAR